MKLLIITQKIDKNDDVLGFMHGWVSEFSTVCDDVIVVALFVGEYDLPHNVRVYSLGKEKGASRLMYLKNFFRIIWRERKNYDVVLVHMNQIYVLLGGLFWRLWKKPLALWYTHKQVDWTLQSAVRLVDIIFTASVESFRIKTPKCLVMGHGIDVAHYGSTLHILDKTFRILSIGRLSRTKGYEFLFATMEKLHMDGHKVLATIVGAPITEDDKVYEDELHELCARRGLREMVTFVGAVPNSRIAPYLARADLFVNMSQTGSLDKAVLEAMAASVPVLTSNAGLASTLILLKETCMFSAGDVDDFYKKIRVVMNMHDDERQALGAQLRSIVASAHDRHTLIVRICRAFQDKIS